VQQFANVTKQLQQKSGNQTAY